MDSRSPRRSKSGAGDNDPVDDKRGRGCAMTIPHVRYPDPLREGSRVFLAAPSSGVDNSTWARLDLVIDNLEARDLVVEEGACLRHEYKNASAPTEQRARELMSALLRDDVDAVLPPWGGSLAIEVLRLLDWEQLERTRPKWLGILRSVDAYGPASTPGWLGKCARS